MKSSKDFSYPKYECDNMTTTIRNVRILEDNDTTDDKICRPVWQGRLPVRFKFINPYSFNNLGDTFFINDL